MRIDIQALDLLIKESYRNNKTWFAEEIGIDPHYFGQIMIGKQKANSPKAVRGIVSLCKKKNIDYKKYIFFD